MSDVVENGRGRGGGGCVEEVVIGRDVAARKGMIVVLRKV